MRRLPLLLVLLASCKTPLPDTPYLRVTADSGRIYYADARNMLHSQAGGFLAFRDLVTHEKVRLPNGTYLPQPVPYEEVEARRIQYMYSPSKPPRVDE